MTNDNNLSVSRIEERKSLQLPRREASGVSPMRFHMTKYQSFLLKRWEFFDWIRRILLQREFRRDHDFFRACIEEWRRNPPPDTYENTTKTVSYSKTR